MVRQWIRRNNSYDRVLTVTPPVCTVLIVAVMNVLLHSGAYYMHGTYTPSLS